MAAVGNSRNSVPSRADLVKALGLSSGHGLAPQVVQPEAGPHTSEASVGTSDADDVLGSFPLPTRAPAASKAGDCVGDGGTSGGGGGVGGGGGGGGDGGDSEGPEPEREPAAPAPLRWLAVALSLSLMLPPSGLVELAVKLSRAVLADPCTLVPPSYGGDLPSSPARRPRLARREGPRRRRFALVQHAAVQASDGENVLLLHPASVAAALLFPAVRAESGAAAPRTTAAEELRRVLAAAAALVPDDARLRFQHGPLPGSTVGEGGRVVGGAGGASRSAAELASMSLRCQLAGLADALEAAREREAALAARLITRRAVSLAVQQGKVRKGRRLRDYRQPYLHGI